MEMAGALAALKSLESYLLSASEPKVQEAMVFVYSDSKYVVDGMNQWMRDWKVRGWRKGDKKPPENLQLWQELDQIKERFWNVTFYWVKGHTGHPQNEYCDHLANQALDESGF